MKPSIILCCLLLTSCTFSKESQIIHKKIPFDVNTQAKLRMYGSYNMDLIRNYTDTDCSQWENTKRNSANRRFINGLPRKARNISIGIPPTNLSKNTEKDTGMVIRDTYREITIPAGKPIVLDGASSIISNNRRIECRIATSFTPKAGKYYETRYVITPTSCDIEVYNILDKKQDDINLTSKISTEYCKKPKTSF